jgi:hypothetical protein
MVEDGFSSVLLALVVVMISVLGLSFFDAVDWSDFAKSGKATAVAIKDSVNNNEDLMNKIEQVEQGRVLGVQSIRPVDFVDYPVVHIVSGARNVFESPAEE